MRLLVIVLAIGGGPVLCANNPRRLIARESVRRESFQNQDRDLAGDQGFADATTAEDGAAVAKLKSAAAFQSVLERRWPGGGHGLSVCGAIRCVVGSELAAYKMRR